MELIDTCDILKKSTCVDRVRRAPLDVVNQLVEQRLKSTSNLPSESSSNGAPKQRIASHLLPEWSCVHGASNGPQAICRQNRAQIDSKLATTGSVVLNTHVDTHFFCGCWCYLRVLNPIAPPGALSTAADVQLVLCLRRGDTCVSRKWTHKQGDHF